MTRLASTYFGILFALGFLLGTLRVMLLVPSLGQRNAELLEIPVMLVAIFFVSRPIARRCQSTKQAVGVGFMALALLLSAELMLAAILFRKSPLEALLDKDPVSGAAYYASLFLFAIMPAWMRATIRR